MTKRTAQNPAVIAFQNFCKRNRRPVDAAALGDHLDQLRRLFYTHEYQTAAAALAQAYPNFVDPDTRTTASRRDPELDAAPKRIKTRTYENRLPEGPKPPTSNYLEINPRQVPAPMRGDGYPIGHVPQRTVAL